MLHDFLFSGALLHAAGAIFCFSAPDPETTWVHHCKYTDVQDMLVAGLDLTSVSKLFSQSVEAWFNNEQLYKAANTQYIAKELVIFCFCASQKIKIF